jgi:hypothetical protein
MPAEPPEQATHTEDGATDLPAETAPRPADAGVWDQKDLTSERDAELDTITADQQVRIRRIAIELVGESSKKPESSS